MDLYLLSTKEIVFNKLQYFVASVGQLPKSSFHRNAKPHLRDLCCNHDDSRKHETCTSVRLQANPAMTDNRSSYGRSD